MTDYGHDRARSELRAHWVRDENHPTRMHCVWRPVSTGLSDDRSARAGRRPVLRLSGAHLPSSRTTLRALVARLPAA